MSRIVILSKDCYLLIFDNNSLFIEINNRIVRLIQYSNKSKWVGLVVKV